MHYSFSLFVCLFIVAGSAPSLHHEEHASYLQVVFVFLILLLSLQTKLFTCPYISLQRLWIEDSCPNNGIHFIRHNLHQFPKQKKRSQVMSIKIHRSSSKNLDTFQSTDRNWPHYLGIAHRVRDIFLRFNPSVNSGSLGQGKKVTFEGNLL